MKKIIGCLLAILMLTALVGCGVKEKIAEKAAEKFIEGIGGGQVDIDGDKVTVKGEDGETLTVGGADWPTSDIAKAIPEFTKGEIASVMEVENGMMVTVESVKEADYEDYLEKIKKDFAADAFESNSEDYRAYGASNSDGVSVQVMFGDDSVSITVSKEPN